MDKIINLTPHNVRLIKKYPEKWDIIDIPPSGDIARLIFTHTKVGNLIVPIVKVKLDGVMNLPKYDGKTKYIVSRVILETIARTDMISPDTGTGAIRDDRGNIVGVTRWITR